MANRTSNQFERLVNYHTSALYAQIMIVSGCYQRTLTMLKNCYSLTCAPVWMRERGACVFLLSKDVLEGVDWIGKCCHSSVI